MLEIDAYRQQIAVLEFPGVAAPMPVYVKMTGRETGIWYREQEGYTFDLSGRPFAGYRQRRRYRRALDGRMVITGWGEGLARQRPRSVQVLLPEQANRELQLWRQRLEPLAQAVQAGRYRPVEFHHPNYFVPGREQLARIFRRILRWDEKKIAQDIAEYHRVYRPVTILPPDQYLALYVQMSVGCAYNRCLFCDFYHDRPFHVLTKTEFLTHLDAVQRYFGAGISMRRRLFLGDANALHMPADELRQRIAILHQRFAIGKQRHSSGKPVFDGIYSFIDSFTGVRLPRDLLRDLAQARLRRVYIGFETGHEPLRRFLLKPGSTEQVVQTVQHLKEAGIAVGVILLVGIGGRDIAAAHVRDSVAALEAMRLDKQDIIFLSELVVQPDSAYARVAAENGWELFSGEAMLQQRLAFIEAIDAVPLSRRAKIANYDVREFVY